MKNRKRHPVSTHLLAGVMGMGFHPELAKDFWIGSSEPWNSNQSVKFRFMKILYLYVASAVVQAGIPIGAILIIGLLISGEIGAGLPDYVIYAFFGLNLVQLVAAFFVSIWRWWVIEKQNS